MKIQDVIMACLTALGLETLVFAESSYVLSSPGGVHTMGLALEIGELHACLKRGERVILKDLTFGNRLAGGSVLGQELIYQGKAKGRS